mmetsp:Transcript_53/g.190  ORF Transcript_53/g.190 Transcript_53/m.190 type:complete len:92 (+) Transcript_53:547-822(+)
MHALVALPVRKGRPRKAHPAPAVGNMTPPYHVSITTDGDSVDVPPLSNNTIVFDSRVCASATSSDACHTSHARFRHEPYGARGWVGKNVAK